MAKAISIAHVKLNVILKGANVLKEATILGVIVHCHVIKSNTYNVCKYICMFYVHCIEIK